MMRRFGTAVIQGAYAVAVVLLGWRAGAATPGTTIIRCTVIICVLMLIALPSLTRRWAAFGPGAPAGAARAVRLGAYGLVCALLPAILWLSNFAGARFAECGAYERVCDHQELAQWRSERLSDAVSGSLMTFCLLLVYALGVLWLSAHRRAIPVRVVVIGALAGVVGGVGGFALRPLGSSLTPANPALAWLYHLAVLLVLIGAPFAAGLLAARSTPAPALDGQLSEEQLSNGTVAGLWAATLGVLLLSVLTFPTMVLLADHVDLVWANPDPDVPHGTRYEIEMSVGDGSSEYLAFLLGGPLAGFGLGAGAAAIGSLGPRPRPTTGSRTSLPT